MHCISINDDSKCIRVHASGDQDYFTYKAYGSKQRAIMAAIRYRDSLPDSLIKDKCQINRHSPHGEIPHIGITCYRNRRTYDLLGYYVQYQQGPMGLRHTKTRAFRFDQYTDALESAIEFRDRMVKENSLLSG